MLLGLGWIIGKTEGRLREKAYKRVKFYTLVVSLLLVVVFAYSLYLDLPILVRWHERPYLAIFPLIGAGASLAILGGGRAGRDFKPLVLTSVAFVAAFCTLAVSFFPYMLPFSVTIAQASAPPASLRFMFWGSGIVVMPMILYYTTTVYRAFRGKIPIEAAE